LQYSKPNLPRNPDWEGYGKTTKNIFGVGRDQRLARQISWTLPGGFGQTAISVSIAEISKRSSARATTIYSSAAISRRSGLAPGANSIAMTLGRPLASPGFAGGHVPVGPTAGALTARPRQSNVHEPATTSAPSAFEGAGKYQRRRAIIFPLRRRCRDRANQARTIFLRDICRGFRADNCAFLTWSRSRIRSLN
jgi:hypothetical protein